MMKCDICNHDRGPHGCLYCINRKRCNPEKIFDCDVCFDKCYMSHPKSEYWNIELNKVTPLEISLHNNNKFWHTCPECKHDFDIKICHVTDSFACAHTVHQTKDV